MRRTLRTITSMAALALAGCAWTSPGAVAGLRGLSPADLDPAAVSVAVALPSGVGVVPGSTRLFLGAERGDEWVGTTATLVARGERWRVAPADVAALRRTQAVIRRWKAEAPEATSGTLAVTVRGCRLGASPAADARVSVDLALAPDAAPLPLLRGAPLGVVTGDEPLEPCPPGLDPPA